MFCHAAYLSANKERKEKNALKTVRDLDSTILAMQVSRLLVCIDKQCLGSSALCFAKQCSPRGTCPQEGLGEDQNASAVAAVASFHEVVCSGQEHTQKATQHIQDGVTNIVDKVHVLLVYWEKKYKHVWETDKDAFIR